MLIAELSATDQTPLEARRLSDGVAFVAILGVVLLPPSELRRAVGGCGAVR